MIEGKARGAGMAAVNVRTVDARTVKAAAFDTAGMLKAAGLRPTRQRKALAHLLFGNGDRHVTAEALYVEALSTGISVSLATIYNTINQFIEAGLLRAIAIEGAKTYLDTNTSDHQHFYFGEEGRLVDIETEHPIVVSLPDLPEGVEVERIDVLIRVVEARPKC